MARGEYRALVGATTAPWATSRVPEAPANEGMGIGTVLAITVSGIALAVIGVAATSGAHRKSRRRRWDSSWGEEAALP